MKTKLTLSEVIEAVLSAHDYGTINPEAVDTKARCYEWSDVLNDYVPTIKIARALGVPVDSFYNEREIITSDDVVIEISDWAGIPMLRTNEGMLAYIKM
jgi:hypothetical protein